MENKKKKEFFPPRFTEGGVRMPYTPSKEEMENCAYAKKAGVECPRKKGEKKPIFGAPSQPVDCANCSYHPENIIIRKQAMEIRTMPNMEKMRERENEARGLPKDAHRRRM